jgi:hypothetical protein
MKKKVVKLSRQQKKQQAEIAARENAFKEKQEALQKEGAELEALRRKNVMENISSFGLFKPELDAFVSALDGWPGKNDLAQAIINAAQTAGQADMQQLLTKLVRLGFV